MSKIQFYPIDLTYKVVNKKPVIYIYGRTKDNKQICVIDTNFEPYFYVTPKKDSSSIELKETLLRLREEKNKEVFEVLRTELVKKALEGKETSALRVVVNIPKAVPVLREKIKELAAVENVLEYDILYTRRYLIDKKITPLVLTDVEVDDSEEQSERKEKSRVPVIRAKKISQSSDDSLNDLKILAFDIETYNPFGKNTVPEQHPIIMISLFGKGIEKVITWKRFKTNLNYIEFVEGEGQLIERFKELVNEHSPDLLTGYYSDGFDMPFIIKRAEKHKIKLDFSLNYETTTIGRGNNKGIDTTGIIHFDVLNIIKRVLSRKMKMTVFTLDAVSEELLGEGKEEVDLNTLAAAWDSASDELSLFAKYNLKDSKLTFELCEKALPNLVELVKLVGQSPKDINRMAFSQLVEWYLIKRADDFGQFIPNRPGYKELERRRHHRVKGAFVFEPTPGLYKNVVVYDFRSLYPTIIISHNISIETMNCECCKNKEKVPVENFNLWFCAKKEGFFSTVLKDIIMRRMRVKEIMKNTDKKKRIFLDARQNSLKTLSNSFYGYLGFFAARWYNKDCARSVTAYGRHYIHKVINAAKEKGFDVLYSDTDSVFLGLKNKTKKDSEKFCEEINASLPGMMELEYEGSYKSALFVPVRATDTGAKKKYALIDEEDHITIKGFETVRRNVSPIAKKTQEKVIEIILKENAPEKAFEFVNKVIADLKNKKVDTEDLAISTQLTKSLSSYDSIGPHVAVAKRMKANGLEIFSGMIIRYVVTAGKELIRDRAKLPEEVKKGEYDVDYYINNQLLPSVESIFEVFGYRTEDLTGGKKQSRLGEYF
jgi:DNA polymerase elongation subunit (family B)